MEENQIANVILTVLHTWREHIISKKQMEKYYDGKMKVDRGLKVAQNRYEESTMDDMESFIANIVVGDKSPVDKYTFFLPKLPTEEMKLIEDQDIEYLKSFQCYIHRQEDPNVEYKKSLKKEMLEEESKTKYLAGGSRRLTLLLKIPLNKSPPLTRIVNRFLKFVRFKSSSNELFSCCQTK